MRDKYALITDIDHVRLRELLQSLGRSQRHNRYVDLLRGRLRHAHVVSPQDVPRELVTMNSVIGLRDLDLGQSMICTLCYPLEADVNRDRVAVTVPMGTAMLGRKIGDTFGQQSAPHLRHMRIEHVYYQPESAGDFHL